MSPIVVKHRPQNTNLPLPTNSDSQNGSVTEIHSPNSETIQHTANVDNSQLAVLTSDEASVVNDNSNNNDNNKTDTSSSDLITEDDDETTSIKDSQISELKRQINAESESHQNAITVDASSDAKDEIKDTESSAIFSQAVSAENLELKKKLSDLDIQIQNLKLREEGDNLEWKKEKGELLNQVVDLKTKLQELQQIMEREEASYKQQIELWKEKTKTKAGHVRQALQRAQDFQDKLETAQTQLEQTKTQLKQKDEELQVSQNDRQSVIERFSQQTLLLDQMKDKCEQLQRERESWESALQVFDPVYTKFNELFN
eukprot:TRINITY_DN2053_c0_g1_i1.p1 TRINITY_DN2053_c0_g1~~TRINITY_DN2053_c0_g1_i1.p1  ORF type:complete len:314 (+),score=57.65 TRINITY_DN2053_c0_g1_i1:109-1050(+)